MSIVGNSILTINNVTKHFGGVEAVKNLTMSMKASEILGLIGPNGAGKTTVFNLITGVFPLTSGSIVFDGHKINGLQPHRIAQLGISRTFQNIRLFESMTVFEHVKFGQNLYSVSGLKSLVSIRGSAEKALSEEAEDIMNFLSLWELRNRYPDSLPYGQQRQVEIARALAARPRLLLLDEPTAGMNLTEKKQILETMEKMSDKGIGIIVIEHDMRLVMNVCDRIILLNFGEQIAEGSPYEIYANIKAKEVYLGKE
jgi:branched-chain amino acid transport system ATP-binding protein